MAVTKLWSRRSDSGGGTHSSGSIVAETIDYACNPDKTKNITYTMIDSDFIEDEDTIESVLKYVVNENKTTLKEGEFAELEEVLVSGINCQPQTADKEFMRVKEYWDKTEKTLLWHGVQSFEPDEVDPATAHEIGMKLAQRMWGDKFQVVITTHCDRRHIHNHFVVNSVGFADGKKYNYSNAEIYRLRSESDRLCREYGLSVIENPKGKGRNYYDYADGNGRKTVRALIREDIDLAIANSSTLREVLDYLQSKLGYEINTQRKHSILRPPGSTKNFRFDNLDKEGRYTEEGIVERLLHKERERVTHLNKPSYKRYHTTVKNNCTDYSDIVERLFKGTAARGIYWHYYYMLKELSGAADRTQYPKTHFAVRKEATKKIRSYSKHIQFFARTGINTTDELQQYQADAAESIAILEGKRSELRGELQYASEAQQSVILKEITNLNKDIAKLRQEKAMCKQILSNLPHIEEETEKMNNDNNSNKRQERNEDKWQSKTRL